MTATQLQLRRGTESQCNAMVPAEGEPVFDTTNNRPRFGDGSRQGGWPGPNFQDIQNNSLTYGVTGGTGNAYTLALAIPPEAVAAGQKFLFKADRNNTGSATMKITLASGDSGDIAMKKLASGMLANLATDDIVDDGIYEAVYNSTGPCVQILSLIDAAPTALSVGQADLNTSVGTFSALASTDVISGVLKRGSLVTLPSGQYGFGLETQKSADGSTIAAWWPANTSTSYVAAALPVAFSVINTTVLGQQRFINSSPPWNMGNGRDGGFIYLLVDRDRRVLAHYASDSPPWGYNGPTSVRCYRQCPVTKKKYNRTMVPRHLSEISRGEKIRYRQQRITNRIKNADMPIIPHPFGDVPEGCAVVLFNTRDDRVARWIEFQNAGGSEEFVRMLLEGHIYPDSEPITGAVTPPGVMQVRPICK
jgi:hypothetical protein